MQFNRFDILSAYYLYALDYHGGQFTKEYGYVYRAVKAGYFPGLMFRYESLSDNAQEIYQNLVRKNHGQG